MVVSIVGVQAHGLSSTDGADTTLLTDALGRMKISHAQPPAISCSTANWEAREVKIEVSTVS